MHHKTSYNFEQDHWSKKLLVCGIDEVGRGCLAGPIITAAVILNPETFHPLLIDSKKLSQKNLVKMYNWLINHCTYNVAINSNAMIDIHNIYKTTQMTMKQALLHLLIQVTTPPSLILVDAMPLTLTNTPFEKIPIISLIQGESKSASIACASIIAKVTRDTIITRLAQSFPMYGFEKHKGYGTQLHHQNLKKFKLSVLHRETFLKNFLKDKHHEQQSIFC